MKRFLQKSYSWLATLLLAVAFAVSGSASAQTEFTFGRDDVEYGVFTFEKDGISITGFGYNCTYAAWGDYPCINMYLDAAEGPRTMTVSVPTGTIEKIEMITSSLSGSSHNIKDITVNTGEFTPNGNASAVWEGSASEVVFTPGDNTYAYISKVIVYATGAEEGGNTDTPAVAEGIEMPLFGATNGVQGGVSFNFVSRSWDGGSTNLYGNGGRNASYGIATFDCFDKNIVKVEFTCALNGWGASATPADAAMTVVETENLGGSFTTNGAVAIWKGSAHSLTFSSTDDIDVTKIVVYLEEGGTIVKECTVGVDHYADNCKPGKHESSLTRYITLYMESLATMGTWTGSDNCPEEVTLTNEAGQQFPISQFNTWIGSDQLGIVFREEITTPGTYTLHIPEGLVAFQDNKWNKEINVVWNVVAPDNRPTKDVTFDYANEGIVAEKEGIKFSTTGTYNEANKYLRGRNEDTMTFTAPEGCTIKRIVLRQEGDFNGSPAGYTANVGEVESYELTLTWTGDDANVVLTHGGATCYFTSAVVTIAGDNLGEDPDVDPNEACFDAWKALINGAFADIAYAYGYQMPEQDVVGKKPAAVAAPCVEYWANRTAFVQMGMPWETVNAFLEQLYYTTLAGDYAYAQSILAAYEAAEVVTEVVVDPTYTEPVLSAEDVSAEVAYYIYTDARGGLTVDGTQLKGTKEVGKNVDPTDVAQQFAFVNWEGNLYLYSLSAEKFIGKANRGNFTDEPVDPIYFKNAYNGTVMLYFDNSYNFNLGGSNQVTIDNWTTKDAGNSFKIMVAEKFDQTALLEKLAGGGEVVGPTEPELIASGDVKAYICDYELGVTYDETHVVFEQYDNDTYVLKNFLGGDDITFTLSNEAGGYWDMAFSSEKGYTDENDYFHLGQTIGTAKVTTDKIWVDPWYTYAFRGYYGDYYYHEAYILYWNNEENVWGTILVDFLDEYTAPAEPTEWNGNIILPETAASLDDLLSYTVEFEYADEVKAAAGDVLGAIFDGENPYAIALANDEFNVFGDVDFNGSKATVQFVKISDLNAELQASAKAAAARIGGFAPTAGTATVAFSKNSFKVDGQLVDLITKSYELLGGSVTGINGINVNGNDSIYDLSGRRVNNVGSGLYIRNGVKVFMK
ncbi:MAG: hypothetical protein Q4D23_10315 [Bacteroidales bacterium]|nr:hypothetical protein [Bacteroidales bacterium]